MNLKGLSGGGREIKLDFYNQKAIKTCRNPCKILSEFRVGVGVLLQNISREFYGLSALSLALIGHKYRTRPSIGLFPYTSESHTPVKGRKEQRILFGVGKGLLLVKEIR